MLVHDFALLVIQGLVVGFRQLVQHIPDLNLDRGAGLLALAPVEHETLGFEGV